MEKESHLQTGMRVYKYPISTAAACASMPEGARILHVAEQGGGICLWGLVDVARPEVMRYFSVYRTGEGPPRGRDEVYLGTAHCGPFVWHVFETQPAGLKLAAKQLTLNQQVEG